jgi:HK97 gp10 family phage protein
MKEFNSCTALALHFGEIALAQHELEHKALEKCAEIVEKRAKEKIGEYQEQAGPFVAWQELADSTVADRERKGYPGDEPLLRTGDMRDSIEHSVADGEAHVGSNSDIALYQELGTSKMPPRSFLGGALVDKLPKVCEILGKSIVAGLVGKQVVGGFMEIEE